MISRPTDNAWKKQGCISLVWKPIGPVMWSDYRISLECCFRQHYGPPGLAYYGFQESRTHNGSTTHNSLCKGTLEAFEITMAYKTIIRLPRESRVFILEDSEDRMQWFSNRLRSIATPVVWAVNAETAIQTLVKHPVFDMMFLDHDLSFDMQSLTLQPDLDNTGSRVASSIAEHGLLAKVVVIHSWNPAGAANMARILGNGVHIMPFGQFDIQVI